jgi:tRNA-dihydrouridine synthase A
MIEKVGMQIDSRIAVAPMMDWTDRHCRYFLRLLNPSAFLYTEMVTANAIHYGALRRCQ